MSNNSFEEGQYSIILIYPRSLNLRVFFQSYDYKEAQEQLFFHEMGAENATYALRLFSEDQFWKVNKDGSKGNLSPQQNWDIKEHYQELHYNQNHSGSILLCKCSYPYYCPKIITSEWDDAQDEAGEQPVTCLKHDSGRAINNCPNCNTRLFKAQQNLNTITDENYFEGEYLVTKSYPLGRTLVCIFRSFDLGKARDKVSIENMANDRQVFTLRIYSQSQLYEVEADGSKGTVSLQQDWKIEQSYLQSHYNRESDGKILVCECSFPYYAPVVIESSHRDDRAGSPPLTCLVSDNGREIINCPNCGCELFLQDDD